MHTYMRTVFAGALALTIFVVPLDNSLKPYVFASVLLVAMACEAMARLGRGMTGPVAAERFLGAAETLYWAVMVMAMGSLGIFLAEKAQYAWMCPLSSPFIKEIMEGREIVKAFLIAQGRNIYTPLDDYPFLITLYAPVYYFASEALGRFMGYGLPAARMVSAISGVGLAVATAALAKSRGASLWMSLFAAGVLLVSPIMDYALHARPDVLAWAELFIGTIFLQRAMRNGVRLGFDVVGAVAFLTLAAMTKQQTWAFLLAALAWTLWKPDTRALGWRLTLGVGVGCALGLMLAQHFTQGQFLRQTLVFPRVMAGLSSYNSFLTMFRRFGELAVMHWPVAVAAVWSVAARRLRPFGLLDAMILAGLVSTGLSLRWWGASVNHFLGVLVLMLVESAVLLTALFRRRRFWLVCVLLAVFAPLHFVVSLPSGPDPCKVESLRKEVEGARALIESLPGPAVMDAESAYAFMNTPAYDKLLLYDAFETHFFDLTGLWSLTLSRLGQDIVHRRVSAFVRGTPFTPEKLVTLADAYYKPGKTFGRFQFFFPRQDAAILALTRTNQGISRDGAGSLEVVQSAGLKNWGPYVQPLDGQAGGTLTLKVRADRPLGSVSFEVFARFTAPGQPLRVSRSGDEVGYPRMTGSALFNSAPGSMKTHSPARALKIGEL